MPMLTASSSGKCRVCMLVTNDMVSDSRVARHAETLGRNGYEVIVVCLLTERTKPRESRRFYNVIRVKSNLLNRGYRVLGKGRTVRSDVVYGTRSVSKRLVGRLIVYAFRTVRIILQQLALLRAARRTRAHVYCANDLDTLLIARLAAGLSGRVVYDSHELWPDMLIGVSESFRHALRCMEGFLIRRVDAIITVNEFIAAVLARRYSVKSQIHVVYNCASTNASSGRMTPVKRSKGAVKIALYQGGFSEDRGLANVVLSAPYLSPDVVLVFRGWGDIEPELRALASGRRNVRFARPVAVERVVEAAARADVGIVPYLPTNLCNYYASPNKFFEYLSAGLPVAASDIPFMRKVITENKVGALFDPSDPRSIADAINRITRNGSLTRCRRNVASALRKYNWNTETRKLLRVYTKLCTSFR